MHPVLLGMAAPLAAMTVAASPAAALDPDYLTAASVTVHRGSDGGFDRLKLAPGVRHREGRRDHRRGFGGVAVSRWYDYEDRTFEYDSYNDWWHERPHRAFPRWVRENAETCDRRWWSGGVWRC